MKLSKHSQRNLDVIENFILHFTHSSDDERDEYFNTEMTLTPKDIYRMSRDYIMEDHVDGEGSPEALLG